MTFDEAVARELQFARRKHRAPLATVEDAYSVIVGELEEFRARETAEERLAELVSIACMCRRAAEDGGYVAAFDLRSVDTKNDPQPS